MIAVPETCDVCLRRSVLVGLMAPLIEVAAVDRRGRRSAELLALADEDLVAAVAPSKADELLSSASGCNLGEVRGAMDEGGVWAVCRHDAVFPAGLEDDPQAPPVLLARGDPSLLAGIGPGEAVTLVGARRASNYGMDQAHKLAAELAAAGFTVISGMALGIDSKAHEGALGAGGRTAAVLGSGPDVPHPPSGRRLYEEIAERGLILSELPLGTRPYRWTFPARNRIMAALGGMTVVVEAKERSGSLITIGMAADLGRQVGAVPGDVTRPNAAGANALLADGAVFIRDAQDVLDAMLGAGAPRLEQVELDLDPVHSAVLEAVGMGEVTPDEVGLATGLDSGATAAALAALELAGAIRRDNGGRYRPAA